MREERIGTCRLILGDCRAEVARLGPIDAVVSDPPYGIGFTYGAGTTGLAIRSPSKPIAGDDRPFDPLPWLGFPDVILFGANHFARHLPRGKWLVWNKLGNHEPMGDEFSDVEIAWHNRPGADRIFSHLWKGLCRARGRYDEPRKVHVSQKPVALMEWCMSFLPATARTVLDPFMGSGSTLVACQSLGLAGVGIEIDPDHFETACRRVEAAARQADLFVAAVPAPAPHQPDLL